ncbi:MAG: SMP-30/gluconolactonase/LRE family protein [Nitrospirota bacterium]
MNRLRAGLMLMAVLHAPMATAFEVKELATPESMIVDRRAGGYFVSNINGAPTEKDGNGFITKLDGDGRVVARKFIDGAKGAPLHAPKGMAIVGDYLFVTDIDAVKGYDKATGALRFNLDLTRYGAVFLNDLVRDAQGNLYVTDMMSNFIAKIEPARAYEISILAKGDHLGQPNGLAIDPNTNGLVMVNWVEGRVYDVSATGALTPRLRQQFRNLDGVDFDAAGALYFSSLTTGTIYKAAADGTVTALREGLTTPADIGVDRERKLLLVPSFDGNFVMTIPLE